MSITDCNAMLEVCCIYEVVIVLILVIWWVL
jgi:hypothetical protein